MLVLSRKKDEALQIGDDIKITVCHVGNGKVRIGIDAPKELNITRCDAQSAEQVTPEVNNTRNYPILDRPLNIWF